MCNVSVKSLHLGKVSPTVLSKNHFLLVPKEKKISLLLKILQVCYCIMNLDGEDSVKEKKITLLFSCD